MSKTKEHWMRLTPALLAVSLAACSSGGEPAGEGNAAFNALPAANAVQPDNAEAPLEPLSPPAPGQPGGLPDDRTPVSEAPFTPDSAQGAANVVQTYYALIEAGRYADAWALWSDGGKASGGDAAQFATRFATYSEYHANVGAPGAIEAGAGQRYVTVPVQVYARIRATGKPFYQLGAVTLHRTGDIDGATPEQRQWRIRAIKFEDDPGRPTIAVPGGDHR
ncbi:hypothetical protein ACNFJ7_13985 [Sphingomonas sp. HT-1]|uniref:hypothetical protein n=1 Tax=unclassified Sphingomonas TaxID=196159 RepID=UPI00036B98F2|nr:MULTISPECIES: hypothetical protein [unclassified Sphingomonas]KTF67987.1 hypothetical protein ATB93_15500 [Sphingomonas sp. WG]